jgi:hypothetical protein
MFVNILSRLVIGTTVEELLVDHVIREKVLMQTRTGLNKPER